MTDVGTIAWLERTDGRLTLADRATLFGRAAAQLTWAFPRYLAHRAGWPSRASRVDLDTLAPPDTQIARAALEHTRAHAPAYLVNHSLRSYWLARLIGIDLEVDHDDEVLWVATILHDAGLLGVGVDGATPLSPCFAGRGAETVAMLAERTGWDEDASERAAEAVCLHLNGVVPRHEGLEAHLLERGVVMDVTGLWGWHVHQTTAAELFRRHPLLDQQERLVGVVAAEGRAHPGCRAQFVQRWMRLGARLAPWDSVTEASG